MSYTQNIKNQALCNYINPMIDNANVMLKRCINDNNFNCPTSCPGPLNFKDRKNNPKIDYKYDKVLPQEIVTNTLETLRNRRSNTKLSNNQLLNYLNPNVQQIGNANKSNNSDNFNNTDVIEGFKSGDFLSDNGPGKQFISGCPDEYEYDNVTGNCVKKCYNCKVNYNNEDFTDICRPYHYDGIDNFGRIMCSSKIDILGNTYIKSTELFNVKSFNELAF
jgi:hypothetical protein